MIDRRSDATAGPRCLYAGPTRAGFQPGQDVLTKVFVALKFCQTLATGIPFLNKVVHLIAYTAPDPHTQCEVTSWEFDVWLTVNRNSVWIRKTN